MSPTHKHFRNKLDFSSISNLKNSCEKIKEPEIIKLPDSDEPEISKIPFQN
jgi:hypothetical protein